jgi:3-phosphoshikimate 1-carboxyvinyltransferase
MWLGKTSRVVCSVTEGAAFLAGEIALWAAANFTNEDFRVTRALVACQELANHDPSADGVRVPTSVGSFAARKSPTKVGTLTPANEARVIIRPAKRIYGSMPVSGDKSISHRAAIIAAIANGACRISNYSTSADCASTISCLRQLGVHIEQINSEVIIHGVGLNGLRAPESELDCGNSGTTMRLLAGILAGQDFVSTLTGDASLRARPMQRIIEPLEMMGADVSANDGRAPLTIHGRKNLKPIDYELLVASAQVKSCVLLAGLNAQGKTTVVENEVTRDHTERMLQLFGARVETGKPDREPANARFASVEGAAQLHAGEVDVPGDISSAAYFIAAAALLPDSSLEIVDVGLNPTRSLILDVLQRIGCNIVADNPRVQSNEPRGNVRVLGRDAQTLPQTDKAFRIDGLAIPALIDELPLLAVIGSQLSSGIEIRDAKELRVKESDRISATAQNLRAMGADVEEFEDGLRVGGSTKLRGGKIDPRSDHRIAMAFAIAGLLADGKTEIADAECVTVSFPEFFELLESVIER